MIHTHSLDELALQNAWLTIGIFDGVHRGHREILRPLVSGAHEAGGPAVVLTFDPHPAVVLGGKMVKLAAVFPQRETGSD